MTSKGEKAWDEPGVEQVLDGVFRIPLPLPNDGLRAVNVYAIADGDGAVVIDGGWALELSQQRLEQGLDEIDLKLTDIREFLVTHVHRDHYAGALAIRALVGTPVRIGARERPSIEQGFDRAARIHKNMTESGSAELYARLEANPFGDPGGFDLQAPDGWLTPGLVRLQSRELEVVETPGHTQGHVVFHDLAARALFAGDHVLSRITPSIGLEPAGGPLPLQDYLNSLRLMLERPDARLLPAHGPVTDSTHVRVEELLVHHEQRLAASAAAIDQGASTIYEVARILTWTRRETKFDDLEIYNQMLAVGETRVHLDVCVLRGWLARTEDAAGTLRYQRA